VFEVAEDVFEVVDGAVRLAVVEQQAVGQEAAQRGLELVVVRVDEPGHHDLAAGVDRRAERRQVRTDGEDLLAFDQHVGLDEIAHVGVHGHDVAALDDIALSVAAAVPGRSIVPRCSSALGEQGQPGCRSSGPRRPGPQEIAP
jgi:hypothetical protein